MGVEKAKIGGLSAALLQLGLQHAINPGHNIARTKRLHKVRIGSPFLCNGAVFYLTTCGHHPDKNFLESWITLDDIKYCLLYTSDAADE